MAPWVPDLNDPAEGSLDPFPAGNADRWYSTTTPTTPLDPSIKPGDDPMKKTTITAVLGAVIAASAAFAPAASAGYGHKSHGHSSYGYKSYGYSYYKPVYTYRPYYYVAPACKWVHHYGHYKKVCW